MSSACFHIIINIPWTLVCNSRDLSGTKTEENPSGAICGGSSGILTGLLLFRPGNHVSRRGNHVSRPGNHVSRRGNHL
jgi:hypothetical protein